MNATSDAAPLTGRFGFRNPSLLFPRARLGAAGLLLTGWHWRGRYRRFFPADSILQADVLDEDGLLLWLASGETIRLHIHQARVWKRAIEAKQTPTASMAAAAPPLE